jgi:hypothetical protein
VRTMQLIAPTRRRGAATSVWSCSRGLASCCTPLAGQPVEGVSSQASAAISFPCVVGRAGVAPNARLTLRDIFY